MKKTVALALALLLLAGCCPVCALAEQAAGPVLRLDPAEITVTKGRSKRVAASVTGLPAGVKAGRYQWTSSDPKVAVYEDGFVRGVGGGRAVITCSTTLTDGTALSAQCAVTVTVSVNGISAPQTRIELMAGDTLNPQITVTPENATNQAVTLTSSDEQVVRVTAEGLLLGVAEGRATVTAVSVDNADIRLRLTVTVTRRIGKTDAVITFQGIPWLSGHEDCIRALKESGFLAAEARNTCSYSSSVWHWPENDLLFSRSSAWRTLPVAFSEQKTGAKRTSLSPMKTIGGYLPQTATLIYLNAVGADGKIDPEQTRLIGAYFRFDSRREKGAVIFRELLARLEAAYGEFNRYLSKDIPKYYGDLYREIEGCMAEAKRYDLLELGEGIYLGEYALCTMYGGEHTGVMLSIDTSETVTLFYGRTDAPALIAGLSEILDTERPTLEDAGV